MKTKMLINAVEPEEYRVAFMKDGRLDSFHIETSTTAQKVGNIYKGVIEQVEPRLQACFVNMGSDKNGFLPLDEVHPEYFQGGYYNPTDSRLPPIEKVLKKGQEVLVQITKEMPGRKGAHLTTYISLAGRYLVLTPGHAVKGVSRKIETEEERQRLKEMAIDMKVPEEIGYIVRTAAINQNKRDLNKDLVRLMRLWKSIRDKVKESPVFTILYKEQDLCLRTLRDYYSSDVAEILVDDKDIFGKIREYMQIVSPRDENKVHLYKENRPIFDYYGIEKQIESIYSNKVALPSGGSVVLDSTEALTAIDVNSGRGLTGKDAESMVYQTNLEAVNEIVRQLRLRDLGGLIVIDFIDMKDRNHIREVEKVLRDEFKKDRAKIDTAHISKFGLLEMSRQRVRPSIESSSYQTCQYCHGRGMVMSVEAATVAFMRRIWLGIVKEKPVQVNGVLPTEVALYLQNRKRRELADLEERYGVTISLKADPALPPGEAKLDYVKAS